MYDLNILNSKYNISRSIFNNLNFLFPNWNDNFYGVESSGLPFYFTFSYYQSNSKNISTLQF